MPFGFGFNKFYRQLLQGPPDRLTVSVTPSTCVRAGGNVGGGIHDIYGGGARPNHESGGAGACAGSARAGGGGCWGVRARRGRGRKGSGITRNQKLEDACSVPRPRAPAGPG